MPRNATWLAYCPKDTECQTGDRCFDLEWNEENIVRLGTPCVRGRVEGHLVTWHPNCWLDIGVKVILSKPFNGRGPGRRPLDISDDDKVKRKLILNRYAAYKQKINKVQAIIINLVESDPDFDLLMLEVQTHELNQNKIWWEIQDFGGAPDTWRIPDDGNEYLRNKLQEKSQQKALLVATGAR